MHTSNTRIAIAAAGAILFAVAPAQARPAQQVVITGAHEAPTATVSFADLNMASTAGRSRLDARVRAAVGQVCPDATTPSLADYAQSRLCQRAAQTSADGQVERIAAARR